MAVTVLVGDARQRLRQLLKSSVHCVVTSPPYWGLRDYQLEPTVWGGDPDHAHEWHDALRGPWANGLPGPNGAELNTRRRSRTEHVFLTKAAGQFCNCGAWLGTLGLEPTVELYVDHIVEVFDEVWRVLRRDGLVWLNIGDCYVSAPPGNKGKRSAADVDGAYHRRGERQLGHGESTDAIYGKGTMAYRPPSGKRADANYPTIQPNRMRQIGLKPKDLVMVPFRVALALQARGWWVRSPVIWNKPNVLPESAKDRPTMAHEYLFLLTRAERYKSYFQELREPTTGNAHPRGSGLHPKAVDRQLPMFASIRANSSFSAAVNELVDDRNIRTVWTIPTQPYSEAHFATFPSELIRVPILAGCPPGGTVLDPFAGAGTTGLVADQEDRHAILIEASAEYARMAAQRIHGPLFGDLVEVYDAGRPYTPAGGNSGPPKTLDDRRTARGRRLQPRAEATDVQPVREDGGSGTDLECHGEVV